MEALERHLDAVAARMGAFLRGYDDPRIHVGSKAGFILEFRKIMDLPALGQPGQPKKISYAKAATSRRVSMPSSEVAVAADPVSTLVRGLHGAPILSGETRSELALGALESDLTSLLRIPIMVYYLAIADRKRFFTDVKRMAGSQGLPLVALEEMPENGRVACPKCGWQLLPARQATILKCGKCMKQFEFVRSLPMVPAVAALVSYEMLRRMVALDVVNSYQEEGKIVPLEFGSETA
jgi:ribosomal protein L37AE/L43A